LKKIHVGHRNSPIRTIGLEMLARPGARSLMHGP
jgi:hypothetical protein